MSLEHAIATPPARSNTNQNTSVQNIHPSNHKFATSLIGCALSALFYMSMGQAEALDGETASGAYSASAVEATQPVVVVEATLAAPQAQYLDVRGSLPAGMVMGAAEREIVIEVRGSLDGRPSTPVVTNDRFSAQTEESNREVAVTGSRMREERVDDVPDYQTSRSAWLAQLKVLQDAIENPATTDAEREDLIDQFEAEKAEFARVHPSTDIAAQLAVP